MIDGACHKCCKKSSVIVVGTHADLLTPEQARKKLAFLQSVFERGIINHQRLIKVVLLNTRNMYSGEMDQLLELLRDTNKGIVSMCPEISRMCHMILAFFKESLPTNVDAISLADLLVRIKGDANKTIASDISCIIPLLETLSEKGLIVFIPSEDPLHSWIILNKGIILQKVNGAMFADPSYKEHIHLASNTGIIHRSALEAAFPGYNIDMITQFMICFELCHVVDLSQVNTNMAPDSSPSPDLGPFFYVPALVRVDRPSSAAVPSSSFGWSMIVTSADQFFTPRFLHVLLRRLPFEFALPTGQTTPLHSHFNQRCDVWSRGIKWLSETGVTTIVEMDEMFQSLSLAMSSPDRTDPKYLELAHSVLAVIKKACQEFCPHVEVLEIVSCPPEASSDHSDDTKIELSSLKKALLEEDKHAIDINNKKHVLTKEWMKIEPCLRYLVGGESIGRCDCMCLISPLSCSAYSCGHINSFILVIVRMANEIVETAADIWDFDNIQMHLNLARSALT